MSLPRQTANVVIAGAGMAGIATAYSLLKAGVKNIVICDPRPPLSFTSSVSTESFRDFWPKGTLKDLTSESIKMIYQLTDETSNEARLHAAGYCYFSGQKDRARQSLLDLGLMDEQEVRVHDDDNLLSQNYSKSFGDYHKATGIDVIEGNNTLKTLFPYLSNHIQSCGHVRKAGWFSAHTMGMIMLERARDAGVTFINGQVHQVNTDNHGAVTSCEINTNNKDEGNGLSRNKIKISTQNIVNAGGPFVNEVHQTWFPHECSLPVENKIHAKVMLKDRHEIIPRDSPMLIFCDEQPFPWEGDELEYMKELGPEVTGPLLDRLPGGVHLRPYGDDDTLIMLWDYFHSDLKVSNSLNDSLASSLRQSYPEILIRGLSTFIPDLEIYCDNLSKGNIAMDAGYYTETSENLPLIGSYKGIEIEKGYYVLGALSGYGIMASPACGQLISDLITGNQSNKVLSNLIDNLSPNRFSHKDYAPLEMPRIAQL